MDSLDFDGAFKIWIAALDKSYQRLRAIHADEKNLNDESTVYRDRLREFNWIQSQIFGFKNIWHQTTGPYVRDLASDEPDR